MEIDVASQTGEAGEFSSAVIAGRFAGIAGDALVGISLSWAVYDAGSLVEVGSNAIEAISAIDAAGAVERALAAVTV
jgi:hypothetical protein